MIILIKILSLVLGVAVIFKTYYSYKKKEEGLVTFLFWSIAWLVIMYAAVFPDKVYSLMQEFSSENIGIGTFAGIAFVFLFFVTYRVYMKADRLERQIRDMVTRLGLKDVEKK